MPGQQRRVIADAAQARPRKRIVAHPRVRVRGDDEIGAFGNGVSGHDPGVVEHMQGNAGCARRLRQPVIVGRGDDAAELDALLFAQRVKD